MRRRASPMLRDAADVSFTPAFVRPDAVEGESDMDFSDLLVRLLNAKLDIGPGILWREIIGNGFGLASALLGMRRKVAAWPIGIVGNVLLFTVFLGGRVPHPAGPRPVGPGGPADLLLHRQPVRLGPLVAVPQVRRRRRRRRRRPGWAGGRGRLQLLVAAVVLWTVVLLHPQGLRLLGSGGRRLDPDRLDPGHVRDGARLGRVLADLDRGGHGRRAAAAVGRLLPVGDHVHRLRRLLRDRLRLLVADRTPAARAPTDGRDRVGVADPARSRPVG